MANDAGGSEVVAAWVLARPEHQYEFFLGGPSIQIFQKRMGADLRYQGHDQIQSRLSECDRVITTSSWGSDIEKQVWIWAKRMKVHSVLYADGWADFRNGFRLEGRDYFPDEIWVTNEYARENMIRVGAPRERIEIVPNFYLKQIVDRIHIIESNLKISKPVNRVLYCCENISACESAYEIKEGVIRGYDEIEALDGFLNLAVQGAMGVDPNIRIRPHPSETFEKYEKIRASFKTLKTEFSTPGVSLEEDIAWATQVVGCETTALAVALECNKRSISCIPAKATIQCRLPHHGLIRIQSN